MQVLDKILFKTGRADIQPAGQAVLEKLAMVLKETDDMIRVEGHTDNVPIGAQLKEKYFSNWELSVARFLLPAASAYAAGLAAGLADSRGLTAQQAAATVQNSLPFNGTGAK